MEDTFTTNIDLIKDGISIYTVHDQTGSGLEGFIPTENIPKLIDDLKNIFRVSVAAIETPEQAYWRGWKERGDSGG